MARFLAALLLALGWAPLAAEAAPAKINHVFIIVMENMDATRGAGQTKNYLYGNAEAPYINGELQAVASFALRFRDSLTRETRSLPHYILLEAGTTVFSDATFVCNNEPLEPCPGQDKQNWTASADHLVNQIEAAGLTWMTYQGGLDAATTGACPINDAGLYATKHNPFVYFADIAGAPPRADTERCITHTRDLARLSDDLATGDVANYVFITPNLCDDMHGDPKACPKKAIGGGDAFLAKLVPGLLAFSSERGAVVFIAWDEARKSGYIPFVAAGTGVKRNSERVVSQFEISASRFL